jgi:predicted dehydrogenase
MGARHAKWFVTSAKTTGWLRETELVPKTQGIVRSLKEVTFAMRLLRHGKVPPPFPPHVAKDVDEARALYDLVKEQGRAGAQGIVQGERALSRLEHGEGATEAAERGPYGPGSFPEPYLPGEHGEEEAGT